jgi:Lysylphosphatidylglycerol synthase TM region
MDVPLPPRPMPERTPDLTCAQLMTGSNMPSPFVHTPLPRMAVAAATIQAIGVPIALAYRAGWREVLAAAGAIGARAIFVALPTSLGNYLLRFARWQRFIKMLGHNVPLRRNLPMYLSGLAMTATPGKTGELMRGVFLKPFGVPYAQSFVLFFWDRLSDLAGVLVLILAAAAGCLLASGYSVMLPGILLVVILLWALRPGGAVLTRSLLLLRYRFANAIGETFNGPHYNNIVLNF